MQRRLWFEGVAPAVVLAVALLAGCGDRAEQAEQSTAPAGGPTVAQEQAKRPAAAGLKVVTLNVKGMH